MDFKTIGKFLKNKIRMKNSNFLIGNNVKIGRNVIFNCEQVKIGDGVIIHDNVTFNSEKLTIGDYATIYPRCYFPGPGELEIGHNFWLGINSIIDSKGGTKIGNNVGIGAHSQLWTHMIYGDVMYGNRFHSIKNLQIGNDVWFVGHCLVSPIVAEDKSLAMLGSVVTKDMKNNHVYAGVPAMDITEKIGPQFEKTTIQYRKTYFENKIKKFLNQNNHIKFQKRIKVVDNISQENIENKDVIFFDLRKRTYTKRNSALEYKFMRFLLPEIKFTPTDVHV